MRTLLITILALSCSNILTAQTAQPQIDLSNRVVTITNLQGEQLKDIKLIRADPKGIIYVFANGGGGGKIHYTNLSTGTLKSLGIGTDAAGKEAKLTEQESAEQKKFYEEEKEKMRDPANYQTVHLATFAAISPGVGKCSILESETAGNYIINNLPAHVTEYFKEIQDQAASLNEIKSQLGQLKSQENQLVSRIESLKTEATRLKNESYRGRMAQANNPGYENYTWNKQIDLLQEKNSDNLQTAETEQDNLQGQENHLQHSLDIAQAHLQKLLENRSSSACEVKVFMSKRIKYLGYPVLFCAADKAKNETPNSSR